MYEKANAIIDAFKKADDDLAVYSITLERSFPELMKIAVVNNQILWDTLDFDEQYRDFLTDHFFIQT